MDSNTARRFSTLGAFLAAALLAACQTTQPPDYGAFEDQLAAAGFIMKPANTPDRQAMIARLPAHQFLVRQNGDTIHYVYADALVCDCLYVGTQQAYDQFRANQVAEQLATEQQLTAITYADSAWSWDAWGPWAPDYAPAGFVYTPIGW
ncbi:MAG TPA: hypothetical protein VEH54_05335 [Steroidobacteraceae bacterium]|nr:hypothetical protein [Steroidobacteraceae bacterium]